MPEATAVTSGRRATVLPSRVYKLAFGSRFQDFDGQKTARPISDTRAGTSVSAVISMTPTAIASCGPSAPKDLNLARRSTRKATMTAPAAEVIASPTRSTVTIIAVFLSSPSRSRSR